MFSDQNKVKLETSHALLCKNFPILRISIAHFLKNSQIKIKSFQKEY